MALRGSPNGESTLENPTQHTKAPPLLEVAGWGPTSFKVIYQSCFASWSLETLSSCSSAHRGSMAIGSHWVGPYKV